MTKKMTKNLGNAGLGFMDRLENACGNGDIIFHDDKIKFCPNGDIFIKGKKTANDIDVVNYIRKILGLSILKKGNKIEKLIKDLDERTDRPTAGQFKKLVKNILEIIENN